MPDTTPFFRGAGLLTGGTAGLAFLAHYGTGFGFGFGFGKVQMAMDFCIVLLALTLVEPSRVAWSVVAAVAVNLVLAVNHKPGRYMGT
jgi:uncharacterized membrane-anchored protein YitT (DUF2179 family)